MRVKLQWIGGDKEHERAFRADATTRVEGCAGIRPDR
jgi:hypothetical protein